MAQFYEKTVEIKTVNGKPLHITVWCSDSKVEPVKPPVYKCDVCGKEFDENRKLLLHRNYHTKEKKQGL